MKRLQSILHFCCIGLCIGLLIGCIDATFAPRLAGESTYQRYLGILLVDASVLGFLGAIIGLIINRPLTQSWIRYAGWGLPAIWIGILVTEIQSNSDLSIELEKSRLLSRPLAPTVSADPMGILILSMDTLRGDAIEYMPRLQKRISNQGITFQNAHANSSWTLPSMASLHTGLPVSTHGAHKLRTVEGLQIRSGLSPSIPTLAEELQRDGFINAAIVTNPFNGIRYGFHRGFDHFEDLSRAALRRYALRRSLPFKVSLPSVKDTGNVVTDKGIELLSSLKEGRFMLWLHYLDAHAPYSANPDKFDPLEECSLPDCFNAWSTARQHPDTFDAAARARIQELYKTDVQYLDTQLERLFQYMDQQDLWKRILVVLVADHGEEFWEHGDVEHGANFYKTTTGIPMIVWAPNEASSTISQPADLTDAFNIISHWAKTKQFEKPKPHLISMSSLLFSDQGSACMDDQFKLIQNARGQLQLFDIVRDPNETAPLNRPVPQELLSCVQAANQVQTGRAQDPASLKLLGYIE